MMTCPSTVNYKQIPSTLQFYSSNFTPTVQKIPSSPNPIQGQCLCDCPFIAALASIAWVNRNFIIKNITINSSGNSYTFNFWDYKGHQIQTSTDPTVPLNPATPLNTPVCNPTGILTPVTVSPQVLLDSNGSLANSSGFYGAGSNNVNEVWPGLYERAYAKFCYYENGIPLKSTGSQLSLSDLTNTSKDPTLADVLNLSKLQWGGNAATALTYLTGQNCYSFNSTPTFPAAGGVPAASSILNFIYAGFCASPNPAYGKYKTRYPLVTWTAPSGSQYNNSGIRADHCYSILGVLTPGNGSPNSNNYFVLRDTYGATLPLTAGINLAESGTWTWYDVGFTIGPTTKQTLFTPPIIQQTTNLASSPPNGIFGIEASTTFPQYFTNIGWAQGY